MQNLNKELIMSETIERTESNEYLTVALSDVPKKSRDTESDYLTADCQKRDKDGNCLQYIHYADTPGSDQVEPMGI